MKDSSLPVKVAAGAMVANVVLNVLLMIPLRQGGLALASSISSFMNMTILWIVLTRRIGDFGVRTIMASAARTCCLSLVMGLCVYVLGLWSARVTSPATVRGELANVAIPVLGGMLFYVGCAAAMRFEEVEHIRRIWKRGRNKD